MTSLLDKYYNTLQSDDKIQRRKACEQLLKDIENIDLSSGNCDVLPIFKQILRLFMDRSEACRELAVGIVKHIINHYSAINEDIISYLMPVLVQRLGGQEIVEQSEEVRLSLISLLQLLVQKYSSKLAPHLNDLINILTMTIVDPYPKIKQESCLCASALAKALPQNFFMQSESLVKPILQNFSHQHSRIRITAILSIGDVVCHGNNKSVDPVMGPLGERMFDQVPGVRQVIMRVVAAWLTKLPDRYSYFHRLLPLILTSLCDEMPDLGAEAWELWQNIGEQYLLENEKDLKDTMDFLTQPPRHYPPEVRRPNLGCRTLVQRNAGKIIPALANELGDWQVDVRLKASQLLCQLVLNAETHLTHHLEKLLVAMYHAVQDDDARVVENVEKAAKYLAHFVPPNVTLSLVLPAMEDGVTHGHLKILGGILWGSEKSVLVEELEGVTNFLQRYDVCWQQSELFQRYLQNCMLAILTVCEESVQLVSQQFFNITFPGAALGDTVVRNTAEDDTAGPYLGIISSLMVYLTGTDKDPRVKLSVYTSLSLLLNTKGSPLESSDELDTFCVTVVREAGPHSDKSSLNNENIDSQMDYRQHDWVRQTVSPISSVVRFSRKVELQVSHYSLINVILPGLVWQAGRTAETVRTSAVACLWAALQDPVPPSMVRATDMCLPLVLGLVEDSAHKTRLLACRVLRVLVQLMRSDDRLNADLVHQVFPAVKTVVALYTPLPPDYDVQCSSALVDALYTTMLVHLDDPDPVFQGVMLDALKDLSHIHPRLLWEKLNNSLGNFRNTKDCSELLDHIKSLRDTSAT
uniref:Uncharacterized protein n=1 Tax=Timema monikensis TaxID=170555 RepID=A0A7R9HNL2_9NEOP|nr:unnamed protein product [Timema monikensis]